MEGLKQNFNRWLFGAFTDMTGQTLGIYRIVFALFVFVWGLPNFKATIGSYPERLYKPSNSLAVWFDLPGLAFFQALDYLLIFSLVMLLFGFFTRWTSLILGLGILVGNSFAYSFGKVDHGLHLLMFAPIVMSFSNWGSHYSVDAKLGRTNAQVQTWPLAVLALIVAFAMFTAGMQKLIGGWLHIDYQAIRFHIFKSYINERSGMLTEWILSIHSKVFWELMDYLIVVFEVGFVVAVFKRRWLYFWIIASLFFHLGVVLVLEITFSKNVLIYVLFLQWPLFVNASRLPSVIDRFDRIISPLYAVLFMLVIGLLNFFTAKPFITQWVPTTRFISTLAAVLMGFFVVIVGEREYQKVKRRGSLKNR